MAFEVRLSGVLRATAIPFRYNDRIGPCYTCHLTSIADDFLIFRELPPSDRTIICEEEDLLD